MPTTNTVHVSPTAPTEEEYIALTRAYWDARVPGAAVSVTVRRAGEVVRYLKIEADGESVVLTARDVS